MNETDTADHQVDMPQVLVETTKNENFNRRGDEKKTGAKVIYGEQSTN